MIPRVFHRIWCGGPVPEHLDAYARTWEAHHPDWEHRLWTEENLPELRNQELFDRAEEIAPSGVGQFRADLARYELLEAHGGVYHDFDFECLRPIDDLVDVEAFAAWEVPGRWINNAILGAEPGHPLLSELIEALPANVKRRAGMRPNKLSGPQFLTPIMHRFASSVRIYPQEWFYPYLHDELDRGDEGFCDAYAVHHWEHQRRRRNEPRRP